MVSAWANTNKMVLGQVKTEEKSNEITAIPDLLELLEIRGCIVTIDAMGCQKKIVKKIVDKGADYVISLKGNQGTLHQEVKAYFDWAERIGFKDIRVACNETVDGEHGRIEIRSVYCTNEIEWYEDKEKWFGLKSIGMVQSNVIRAEKETIERRYYISSLDGEDADKFGNAIREHWSIENNLHWVLDVAFSEDNSRVRKENGAQNFSVIRQVALNLLNQEKSLKAGIKNKRLKAGWDEKYLLKILAGNSA